MAVGENHFHPVTRSAGVIHVPFDAGLVPDSARIRTCCSLTIGWKCIIVQVVWIIWRVIHDIRIQLVPGKAIGGAADFFDPVGTNGYINITCLTGITTEILGKIGREVSGSEIVKVVARYIHIWIQSNAGGSSQGYISD